MNKNNKANYLYSVKINISKELDFALRQSRSVIKMFVK